MSVKITTCFEIQGEDEDFVLLGVDRDDELVHISKVGDGGVWENITSITFVEFLQVADAIAEARRVLAKGAKK